MQRLSRVILFCLGTLLFFSSWSHGSNTFRKKAIYSFFQEAIQIDTLKKDSLRLDSIQSIPYTPSKRPTFQQKDRLGDPFSHTLSPSPLLLQDPSSLKLDVEIDTGNHYTIYEKIGDLNYRPTTSMSFEEFDAYQEQRMIKDYWKSRSVGLDGESAMSGRRIIPTIYISPVFDRIFGGSNVDITPNGFVNLDLGGRFQNSESSTDVRNQSTGTFEFDMQTSMSVIGKIGEKLQVTANFDNNNSFDFQNDLKLEYTGFEEDIIQKLEIGNVSMPVNNSLMTGAQSLFGVKAQLQFGKLFVTALASEQKGSSDVIEVEGGFQGRDFDIRASEYDDNRHFFLGRFFRENYEKWHQNIPNINSGVNIPRVEVYVLNRANNTQGLRNFAGIVELGEAGSGKPSQNGQLFNQVTALGRRSIDIQENLETVNRADGSGKFVNGTDFEIVTSGRKLDEAEYTVNTKLGYISLSRRLGDDEAIAVSYQYTFNGKNYSVGELTDDYQKLPDEDVIILKLLRPRRPAPELPTWDLMMKNVYSLSSGQLSPEGFQLRVIYRDDATGIDNPSLQFGQLKDKQLIEVLNLDRLNQNNDPQKDGNFDFVDGITVNTKNSLVIFPVLEPFGEFLERSLTLLDDDLSIEKFVFNDLYDKTQADAEQVTSKNKFFLKGRLTSGSSSEFDLPGFNIAEGSVNVTAGNTPLVEGIDYLVNYQFGRVSIINPSITNSGKTIRISFEKQDVFSFQSRFLVGTRLDYKINDDINIGATLLKQNQRTNGRNDYQIGDEPTSNTKFGLDLNYRKDSRLITKIVDALPLIQTKEKSTVTFNAEYAKLSSGTSNLVNGDQTAYVDNFDAAATPTSLGGGAWEFASTPKWLEGSNASPLASNDRRAKIAWYSIDRSAFYTNRGQVRPDNISENDLDNHYVRAIRQQEIFRRDLNVVNPFISVFDIAYFPAERGAYNYNSDNLSVENINGKQRLTLNQGNIAKNWAGITRSVGTATDFDNINTEYIEFWLMDPFIDGDSSRVIDGFENKKGSERNGGQLYFNLGKISEDLVPDNAHGFENGLPASDPSLSADGIDVSEWGRVTKQQFLTDAFENSNEARSNQDVGFDGLRDQEENELFGNLFTNPQVKSLIDNDISGDNFKYYLDPTHDANNAKILERYKNYNNTDGNSPASTPSGLNYIPQGGLLPDNEDLNRDNTLSTEESYYEYKVDITRDGLQVGKNFVVDKVQTTQNGDSFNWYLFRIPIREAGVPVGGISNFKSIQYIRTYLTGFEEPTVLRMVNFQLVGSQWRRFQGGLKGAGAGQPSDDVSTSFEVSVLNYEENGQGGDDRVGYELPPGIQRNQDNTTVIDRRDNEQALQICVDDLEDNESQGVFKNMNLDLISYGRLKMFIHADSREAQSGQLSAFVRIGTDVENNYYEIEIPLTVTPYGSYTDPTIIWPNENELNISFDDLYAVKVRRDRDENARLSETYPLDTDPYLVGNQKIRVRGKPDMSSIQVMMLGVRNIKDDFGAPLDGCLWFNELRVTDFDSQSGWAANARMNIKLADFANISASTRKSTPGFGGIQQRISERTREDSRTIDFTANVNLDKLLPEKSGIQLPMYVSYENTVIKPKFDPADPDIPISASIESQPSPEAKENYRNITTETSTRKSINFTNVRKIKTKEDAKSRIYDIENLNFTYSYSEIDRQSFNTPVYQTKNIRGAIGYDFAPQNKSIEPFKNSKWKSGYFKAIKDFNFSLLPSSISVRANLDRRFVKTQYRTDQEVKANFEKSINFDRTYDLRWSLTKNLSLDYSARAHALVDESEGDIETEAQRKEIWDNIKDFGRMKTFDQSVNVNYRLPLDKIPLLDWVNSDLRYGVGYSWIAGPDQSLFNPEDSLEATIISPNFGNSIQNNRERSINGKVDFVKLYNKSKFLKKINSPPRRRRPSRNSKADTVKTRENKVGKGLVRTLMSLRSVTFNYGVREGTRLPGFTPQASFFGMDSDWLAPGLPFILGNQNAAIRKTASENGWLTDYTELTDEFTQTRSVDLNVKANVEPIKDFRVTVEIKKTKSSNYLELYRNDTLPNSTDLAYQSLSPSRTGNYRISFSSINTAFNKNREDGSSPLFEQYESNRLVVLNRLSEITGPGIPYDTNSQDIVIPAFIAAYAGKDINQMGLGSFPRIPIPNWRLDYAGLSRVKALSQIFSSVTISHSYSSTFEINSYVSNPEFNFSDDLLLNNNIEDFILGQVPQGSNDQRESRYQIPGTVVISERFAPFLGLNIRTRSKMTIRLEYNKERNLALNLSNSDVTELKSNDVLFDFGYTKANFKIPFKMKGRTVILKNDLSFRMSLTIRDTETIQRKIDEAQTITDGNMSFQLRPTISYVVNQKLNLQFYYDRNVSDRPITTSSRRANTSFGVQVRFSLAQ